MTGLSKPAAGALLTAPLTKGARRTWLLALSPIPARLAGLTVARDRRACCIWRAVTTAGEKKGSWAHWEQTESHIFRPVNDPHCPLRPWDTGEHPGPRWISQTQASSVLSIGKVGQMIPEDSQVSASLLRPCSVICPSLGSQGMPEATTHSLPPSHPSLFLPFLCSRNLCGYD